MIYAIGDIHGQRAMLEDAHERIARDMAREGTSGATVVHLGDLVDRGPDSRGVIEFLIRGTADNPNWVILKGNHDRLFSIFLDSGRQTDDRLRHGVGWLSPGVGGEATLASYGVVRGRLERDAALGLRGRGAVPDGHAAFLRSLALFHREEDCLFVHAGIRPGVPLEAQSETDLLWIRDEFLWHAEDHPWLVVHGHTPVEEAAHYGNRVNLDTGAGYGDPLTAAAIEGREVFLLTAGGRVRLPAP